MASIGSMMAAHMASGASEQMGGAIGSMFGKKGRKVGMAIGRMFKMRKGGVVRRYSGGGKVRVPPRLHFARGGTVVGRRRIISK